MLELEDHKSITGISTVIPNFIGQADSENKDLLIISTAEMIRDRTLDVPCFVLGAAVASALM